MALGRAARPRAVIDTIPRVELSLTKVGSGLAAVRVKLPEVLNGVTEVSGLGTLITCDIVLLFQPDITLHVGAAVPGVPH